MKVTVETVLDRETRDGDGRSVERCICLHPEHCGPQRIYIATGALYGVHGDALALVSEFGPLIEEALVDAAQADLGPEPFARMSTGLRDEFARVLGQRVDGAMQDDGIAFAYAEWAQDIMRSATNALGYGELVRDRVVTDWRPQRIEARVTEAIWNRSQS